MSLILVEPLRGSLLQSESESIGGSDEEHLWYVWINTNDIATIHAFNVAANAEGRPDEDDTPEFEYVIKTTQGDIIRTQSDVCSAINGLTLNPPDHTI